MQGSAFFIKGIDYQPGGSSGYDSTSDQDALTDTEGCYRDAYVFQQLGINTVRIYSLNPELNHDECVTIFNNAGIYLLLDVNSGEWGSHLNRADPASSYNEVYLSHVFKFIEAFKNYPNVLGFFSGNEIINDQADYAEINPKYIRAVQRDMKQYIANHANRTIPVGYSAADGVDLRTATLEYFQCQIDGESKDDDSTADFFGLNSYEWCSGQSDWDTSGYAKLNSTLSNTTIPLLFSEFGCNAHSPRTFDEISKGLFDGLIEVFSGGLVYEYSQEASDYGVVEINSDGSIEYLEDFPYLKSEYSESKIPTIAEDDVSDPEKHECDSDLITSIYKEFGADFDIPEQPSEITDLIENGVDFNNTGKILDDLQAKKSSYKIVDQNGDDVSDATVNFEANDEINVQSNVPTSSVSRAAPSSTGTASTASSSASSSSSGAAVAAVQVPGSYSLFGLVVAGLSYLI